MRLTITGFRHYLHTTVFDIKDRQIVLISGPSGSGKSSIFQAIYWCLYGSLRSIYHNSGNLDQCVVELSLKSYKIFRQARPRLFKVTIVTGDQEQTYLDDVAQQIINSSFGVKELWKACCYIEQYDRCSLLSGSNSDRMDLLNQLSFLGENPEDYIVKIDTAIKDVQHQITLASAEYNTELQLYNTQLNNIQQLYPNMMTMRILSDAEIAEQTNQLENLKLDLAKLYQEQLEQAKLLGVVSQIHEQIKQKTALLDRTNKLINNTEDLSVRLAKLLEQQEKIQNDILQYHITISSYAEKERKYIQHCQFYNAWDSLEKEYQKVTSFPSLDLSPFMSFMSSERDDQINQIANQEIIYNTNCHSCNELRIDYNKDTINAYISQITGQLEEIERSERLLRTEQQNKQQRRIILQRYSDSLRLISHLEQQLKSYDLTKLDSISVSQVDTDLIKLNDELASLHRCKDLLYCPSCHKSLRYKDNTLIPGERDPPNETEFSNLNDKMKQLRELKLQIETMNKIKLQISSILVANQELVNDRTSIEKEIASTLNIEQIQTYDNNVKSQLDKYEYTRRSLTTTLVKLRNIVIVDKPVISASIIRLAKKVSEAKQNLIQITGSSTTFDPPSKSTYGLEGTHGIKELTELKTAKERELIQIKTAVEQTRTTIEQEKQNKHIIEQLTKDIANLKIEESRITIKASIDSEISNIKNCVDTLNNNISFSKYLSQFNNWRSRIIEKSEKLTQLSDDLQSLAKLKQNAVDLECELLENTLDSINNSMEQILNKIFELPITVYLRLEKQLKSATRSERKTKNQVNLGINYRGAEYDSISSLSGGEGDRVSLALILALSQISTCPILLLDECMASLNSELRYDCIEAIRELRLDSVKNIIIINHEDTHGNYDQTIKL